MNLARIRRGRPAAMNPEGGTAWSITDCTAFPASYSSYDAGFLDALAIRVAESSAAATPTWCIFDTTALGAGTSNVLNLMEREVLL